MQLHIQAGRNCDAGCMESRLRNKRWGIRTYTTCVVLTDRERVLVCTVRPRQGRFDHRMHYQR
jgi:hypothetical protein